MLNNIKVLGIKSIEKVFFMKYNLCLKIFLDYNLEFKEICLILTSPLGIGDLIMMTPTIKTFKKNFPNSNITLITDKDIFDSCDSIDKIILVKGTNLSLIKKFKNIKYKFDLGVVLCRGVNQVLYLNSLDCKYQLGYLYGYNISSNFKLVNNNLKFEKLEHFSNMGLKICESLGLSLDKTLIKPVYSKKVISNVEEKFKNLNLISSKHTIGLNTNVMWESRRWDEKNYIKLIENLYNKFNFVLLGGPGKDVILNSKIENELISKDIKICNVSGMLSLKESIQFMSKLDLLITADSGPMHFALMMDTPTLGLFGPVNPYFRLPLGYEKSCKFDSLWFLDYADGFEYNYENEYFDERMNGLKAIKVKFVCEKTLNFFKNKRFNYK
jgi:ADP-heptose:LPS heptosyltransferase